LKTILLLLVTLFALTFQVYSREAAVSFEYFQRVIFVTVTIDETDDLLFLFDTGSNISTIDELTLEKMDLPFMRTDVLERNGRLFNVAFVRAEAFHVGKAKVKNLELAVENLGNKTAPGGRHVDGILGTDFMKYFTVGIDFVKKKITFSTQSACATGFIPFEMDHNVPKINVTINDTIQTSLHYNSGSNLFVTDNLSGEATNEPWIALALVDTIFHQVNYFSGAMATRTGKITALPVRTLFFTGQKVKHPFIFIQPKQGTFSPPENHWIFRQHAV
jgi:hypothetical protein